MRPTRATSARTTCRGSGWTGRCAPRAALATASQVEHTARRSLLIAHAWSRRFGLAHAPSRAQGRSPSPSTCGTIQSPCEAGARSARSRPSRPGRVTAGRSSRRSRRTALGWRRRLVLLIVILLALAALALFSLLSGGSSFLFSATNVAPVALVSPVWNRADAQARARSRRAPLRYANQHTMAASAIGANTSG